MGPNSNEKCIYERIDGKKTQRGNVKIEEQWCTEDCQESPQVRKHGMDSASESSEGTNFANTLISDSCPPELWENKCLMF